VTKKKVLNGCHQVDGKDELIDDKWTKLFNTAYMRDLTDNTSFLRKAPISWSVRLHKVREAFQ
jgi:hypothetical protein